MVQTVASTYLSAPHEAIIRRGIKNRKRTYNIESFLRVVLADRELYNMRMTATCFITAETPSERTTWRDIQRSSKYGGILFKYESQLEEVYKNAALWQLDSEWLSLKPPIVMKVEETHGCARRAFVLAIART